METALVTSWVIREKATGQVICETFNAKDVAMLKNTKYEAVPIMQYLQSINGQPQR